MNRLVYHRPHVELDLHAVTTDRVGGLVLSRQVATVDVLVAVHQDVTPADHVRVGLLRDYSFRVAAECLLLVLDVERLVRLLAVD